MNAEILPEHQQARWPEGHAKSLHTVFNWRVVPAEKLTLEEKRQSYNKAKYQEKLAAQKARKANK